METNLLENVTVEMIHNDFYSVNNNLLSIKNFEIDSELIEKKEKLEKIGVSNNHPIIQKYVSLRRQQYRIDEKIKLQKYVEYYNKKYPFLKVIDYDSVMKICDKYKLVLNNMDNFFGDIPDKNINEILQNYKLVSDEDRFKFQLNSSWGTNFAFRQIMIVANNNLFDKYINEDESYYVYMPEGIEKFIISVKDPIALLPIKADESDYHYSNSCPDLFLILSAWGEEANDELVVNEKLN